MNYTKTNYEALQHYYPIYTERFRNSNATSSYEAVAARSGDISAKINGVLIHSARDPAQEASRLIKTSLQGESKSVIFLGFGLGYQIEAFLHNSRDGIALVVEPDITRFSIAMELRDLTGLISSRRIKLLLGNSPNELLEHLPELSLNSEIIKLRSVYDFDRHSFEESEHLIQSYRSKEEINANTLKRFGKLWVRNFVKNIKILAEAEGVSNLYEVFKGKPGLLLAAGPSLNAVLPHLDGLRQRAVIVAVDTAVHACLRRGITPDIAVVVDPQYWNTRHLDGISLKGMILVSESSTHPRVFRSRAAKTLFCSSLFPLGVYVEKHIPPFGKLGAGGSVATSAWDLIRNLGCSPIFIAGLDLGYPEYDTHVKGSFFEEFLHASSDRFSPFELASFKMIHDASPFYVPSNNDSTVFTDRRMIIYKLWFETQTKITGAGTSYNLSSGGVKIEGIPYSGIDTLIELSDIRDEIDHILHECMARSKTAEDLERDRLAIYRALGSLTDDLISIETLCRNALEIIDGVRLSKQQTSLDSELIQSLEMIDNTIYRTSNRNIVGFLMQASIREIVDTNAGNDPYAVLENSRRLYAELYDSAAFHRKLIEKTSTYR